MGHANSVAADGDRARHLVDRDRVCAGGADNHLAADDACGGIRHAVDGGHELANARRRQCGQIDVQILDNDTVRVQHGDPKDAGHGRLVGTGNRSGAGKGRRCGVGRAVVVQAIDDVTQLFRQPVNFGLQVDHDFVARLDERRDTAALDLCRDVGRRAVVIDDVDTVKVGHARVDGGCGNVLECAGRRVEEGAARIVEDNNLAVGPLEGANIKEFRKLLQIGVTLIFQVRDWLFLRYAGGNLPVQSADFR